MKHTLRKSFALLLLLCTFTVAFALCAQAETKTGSCGANLTYTLDTDIGVLSITGTGKMTDWSSSNSVPWYATGTSIRTVTIADGVTSIGDSAFEDCDSLTSITIPDSVTSIGSFAFYGCSSFTSITIGNGVTRIGGSAFYYCSSLTSITIPDGVTSIGGWTFAGCSNLTSIAIPDSVTRIGEEAFSNTPWYNSQPDGVVYAGKVAYKYKGTMPSGTSIILREGTTGIADSAFLYCSSLTSITIPSGVTSIGSWTFAGCSNLTSITIPSGVTSIGYYAFDSCSSLNGVYITDIAAWCGISFGDHPLFYAHNLYLNGELVTDLVIPDSVTSIGGGAFYGCSSLTSITIPSGVTSIGGGAFAGCSNLTSIHVDANNPNYTDIDGVLFNKAKTTLKQAPGALSGTYIIPGSVTSIGDSAFEDCDSLTSITIPDSVTSIGSFAFYGCSSFTSITIGNGVTRIGGSAFYYCSNLTSITIPDGVTSIGGWTFAGCSNLTSITIPDSVTSIGDYAFYDTVWYNNQPDGVVYAGKVAYGYRGTMPRGTSITLREGTTGIAGSAFYGYSSLTSISLPNSVTSIGNYAFSWCSSLTSITILNPQCSIYDNSYTISSSATIYGYAGSTAEAYAAKYSRTFVALEKHTHTYAADFTVDVSATCVGKGEKSRHCTVCDAKTDVTEIPATGKHTYGADNRCTVCGAEKPPYTPGDCNEDGVIDKRDLLRLQKYLADWDVEINMDAADCNGDGEVDKRDLLRLQKYLADWDVKLGA